MLLRDIEENDLPIGKRDGVLIYVDKKTAEEVYKIWPNLRNLSRNGEEENGPNIFNSFVV